MDAFEYLSVLISIILGLGITQLLLGFARWLEQRSSFRAYGPALAWAGLLLLIHVQTWWSMYGLRHFVHWNFLQFAVVLLQPVVLFLLASVVFPGSSALQPDLRSNFLHQRHWFFGLFLALLVVSLLRDLVRTGSLPRPLNVGFHVILFVIGGLGLAVRKDVAHRILAYSAVFSFVVYIVVLFSDL